MISQPLAEKTGSYILNIFCLSHTTPFTVISMISTSIRRVSRAPALRRALTSQSKAFEPTAPKIFGNFTNVSLALTFGAVSVGGYMLSDSKAVVACESESDGRSVLALSLNEGEE